MARKVREKQKSVIFSCFQVSENAYFRSERSKAVEVRALPSQIDPRGHAAIGIYDIPVTGCVENLKRTGFFIFPGAENAYFRSERSIPIKN